MIIAKKYADLIQNNEVYSDKRYLDLQIQVLQEVFYSEAVAIKNVNLEYVAFSNAFAKEFNMDTDALGRIVQDVSSVNERIYKDTAEQEHSMIIKKIAQDVLVYINRNKKYNTYLVRKRPLINSNTGNVVGIVIFAIKTDILKLRRMFMKFHNYDELPQENLSINLTSFTHPEQLVITCLLLGFRHQKEIGSLISTMTNTHISKYLVKNTLRALYNKYSCNSILELINLISASQPLSYYVPEVVGGEGSDIIIQKLVRP